MPPRSASGGAKLTPDRRAGALGLIALAGLALVAVSPVPPGLEVRFIANAAIQISDGKTTLLTDFPYQSGSFGYMTYRFEDVRPKGEVVAIITHGHSDHFDPALFSGTKWSLVAPREVTAKLEGERVLPLAEVVRFRDIEIRPLETPHGDTEHYSYLVTWKGKRLYFTGDTDSLDRLLSMEEVDVAFVTPWLLEQARESGKRIPGRKIVVYHHRADEKAPLCPKCLVPRQGQSFRLETKR